MSMIHSLQRLHDLEPTAEEFHDAVVAGLSQARKTLPCKFFYDAEGSALFDRICELPEYYPTRTESALLAARAGEIARLAGPGVELVEFGSGAGVKIRLLLGALADPAAYVPVDISRSHLLQAAGALAADFPALRIAPVCADYTRSFALPRLPGQPARRMVGFFPGSTIGNFTPAEATQFLARTADLLGPGALMIVGADLPKGRAVLEAAYDDAAGITAAFNRNLLYRINRELGGDFDVENFDHKALWNAEESRVEMHLVSRIDQVAHLGPHGFAFAAGETIHTENSYKYGTERFAGLAGAAGWTLRQSWTDPAGLFAIHALELPAAGERRRG